MPNDEEQIRQLVDTWMRATSEGDVDSILELVADDVVFLITGQPPMMGKAAFAEAMRGAGPAPKIEADSDIQEIQIHGDTASMWNKLRVSVTPPGATAPMVRSGHTLTVLRKRDGRWVIERDANMLAPVSD